MKEDIHAGVLVGMSWGQVLEGVRHSEDVIEVLTHAQAKTLCLQEVVVKRAVPDLSVLEDCGIGFQACLLCCQGICTQQYPFLNLAAEPS